jgi:hypothetical protein
MPISEGIAALTSLKSLYELAREMRSANDPEKLRAAAAQMFDLALAAREQTAALQEERNAMMVELATLKAEIEKTKAFDTHAENYCRETTPSGATVYRESQAGRVKADSPYFCPNCFANKRVAIMNPGRDQKGHVYHTPVFDCSYCNHSTTLPRLRGGSGASH